MADVKITKKPSLKVTSLGNPTKSGNTFKEDWKIPADAKSGKKNDRFTHVYYQWKKWVWNGKSGSNSVGTIVKKATVKLGASGDTSSSWGMSSDILNDLYPKKAGKYLTSVSFSIVGKNSIGSGPAESGSYKLAVPPVPTISKSVNIENGTVSFTIKSTSTDAKPRTDTLIWIGYKRNINARPGIPAVKDSDFIWITDSDQKKINGKSYTSAEITKSVDLNYATGLGPDDYVKVICKAKARGVRGDSAIKGPNSSYAQSATCHIWAQPGKPTISVITVTGQVVTVKLSTGHQSDFHVVDKVQLQRAHVDTGMAPDHTTSWSDVSGAVDDETCVGLTDNVNNAMPSENGKTVWYRVKSTHDAYEMFSDPMISSIVTSTESADQSKINSLSVDTNVVSGTVNVFCGFSKAFKNGSPTSNSIVYSYAELVEPQTYASLEFSNETILMDTDLGIVDNDNGEHNISWYIQNLTPKSKYVLRVCRAKCSDSGESPSVDSRGKWAFYTIADNSNGVSAKLLDASPFLVPSPDDILQDYLNSDSNIVFMDVGSQFSGKITARMQWWRGSYSVLGMNDQKGSNKSVLEYLKKGTSSWQEGDTVVDVDDPDQEGLDSSGLHEHIFTINGLDDGEKYRLRFKRILTAPSGSSPIPSQDLESEYVYFTNDFQNYITVFDSDSTISGKDECKIEGVVADTKKGSMIVDVSFTNEYETNGTQLMWSTKYPPKALTTGTVSTYDVPDSELASSAIVDHNGSFSLIVDELKKGDLIYLDARRFIKDNSNTSYGVNYASGNRYSDQECAWSVYVSAEDDRAYIDSLSPSSDGTVVNIITSHDENDDSDGTEISYSKRSDAWNTTSGPETYELKDSEHEVISLESLDLNDGDRVPIEPREISISDLDPGTRYYFKVRRYMNADNGTSYGNYSEIMEIVTPYTVNQDVVYIDSIESEKDGQGLRLTLGWNDDSSTETEISYSDYEDAWISSSGAETFEVVDADWQLEEIDSSESYKYKAVAIIRDLEEGVKYYVRARRKSDESHGAYTDTFEAIPLSTPDEVVLNVPSPVTIGENFSVSWAHQAHGIQTAYILNCNVEVTDSESVTNTAIIDLSRGEGSVGFIRISWDDFYSKLDNLILRDNNVTIDNITSLSFTISITTGGEWVSSTVQSSLATAPLCSINVDSTIVDGVNIVGAQPMMFSIFSNISTTVAFIRLESQGIMQLRPDGEIYQPQGDCIWTSVIDDLVWADIEQGETPPEGMTIKSRVTPPMLDLIDNGSYILYVSLYDNTTSLVSEEVSFPFMINWSHQASAPNALSRIDKVGTGPSIAITPIAPDGYTEGDVCDIYRRTQSGAQLIYEGADFGTTIVDDYPPYSMHINTVFDNLGDGIDLWYTLMTRTVDGDIEFLDFPYSLTRNGLTLDWEGGSKHLELPWNLNVSNSYSKDFENRVHMDGTVTGYWNPGSTNTGSFDTVMCKIDCSDVDGASRLELCRQLAMYSGPVFVRTPYREAFCADVTLEISQEHDSPTATINLSYTEIDFVDEFSGVYNGPIDDSTT